MPKRLIAYPSTPAPDCLLGYNMQGTFTDLSALEVAADGGARVVRTQPAWANVENYATGVLALQAGYAAALARCAELGLMVEFVAAYGPPYANLGTLTVSTTTATGATVIPVTGAVLASIDFPYCHVLKNPNTQIVPDGKWAYYGALVTDHDGSSITLAAATNIELAASDTLRVHRLRYPALPDADPDEPSVVAYMRYVQFLAEQIADAGCQGWVNLWNETPWAHDHWDSRWYFYDTPPEGIVKNSRLEPIITAALDHEGLPDGVTLMSGATHKTGGSGVVALGLLTDPNQARVLTHEGVHPYGTYPEQAMWDRRSFAANSYDPVEPADASANFRNLAKRNANYRATNGRAPTVCIDETGFDITDDTDQARFLLRRVLAAWAGGASPVVIYALAEDTDYDVVAPGTYTPRTSYTALARLAALIEAIGPDGPQANAPRVAGYPTDQWQGMAAPMHGADGGLLVLWQRTYAATGWEDIPTPEATTVTVRVPSGSTVAEVVDLLTGAAVDYVTVGATIQVPVADAPVAIRTAA